MARPLKHGLDYFPLDTDWFTEQDGVQFVSSRFDEKGELVAIKLLCKIYKTGYFIHWDDDAALLFSKGAGRNITPSLANDVVHELVRRGFFHRGLFERFGVLTSEEIQKTYAKICSDAKRKDWKIEEKYDVIEFTQEETPLTLEETPKNPGESTQRKKKEKKVKESKEGSRAAPAAPVIEHWTKVIEEWFLFNKEKFGDDPSFTTRDAGDLKQILQRLKKRAEIKNVAWTEAAAVERFRKFLEECFKDKWLCANFLLSNLNNQFDKIELNHGKTVKHEGRIKHQPAIQPTVVDTTENWGR